MVIRVLSIVLMGCWFHPAAFTAESPSAFVSLGSGNSLSDLKDLFDGSKTPPHTIFQLKDFRGAVHVHTDLSPDSHAAQEELARAANEIGLNFVMTTDHSNPKIFTGGLEGMQGNTLFIRGMEMTRGGSGLFGACWPPSACNAVLGLGMNRFSDAKNLPEAMKGIREQEALVFVAHPMGFQHWESENPNGIEIYDLADNLMSPHLGQAAQDAVKLLYRLSAVLLGTHSTQEMLISLLERPTEHLRKWDELTQRSPMVGIGTPDAHQNFKFWGIQFDSYTETLRFPSVHIMASELTQQALISALGNGNAYTAFDLIADSEGFKFFAWDDQGAHAQGERVPLSPQQSAGLAVQLPREARIRLFRNGRIIKEVWGTCMDYASNQPGVYRVEAELNIAGDWKPWIFSNPIYLEKKVSENDQ